MYFTSENRRYRGRWNHQWKKKVGLIKVTRISGSHQGNCSFVWYKIGFLLLRLLLGCRYLRSALPWALGFTPSMPFHASLLICNGYCNRILLSICEADLGFKFGSLRIP